jgi:hypothetical protein
MGKLRGLLEKLLVRLLTRQNSEIIFEDQTGLFSPEDSAQPIKAPSESPNGPALAGPTAPPTPPHNEILYCPFCGGLWLYDSSYIKAIHKNNFFTDRICANCGDVYLAYCQLMPGSWRFSAEEKPKNND